MPDYPGPPPPDDRQLYTFKPYRYRGKDEAPYPRNMRALVRAAREVDKANLALREAVDRARRDRLPWQLIADAIGVTRQAAHRRFHDSQGDSQ